MTQELTDQVVAIEMKYRVPFAKQRAKIVDWLDQDKNKDSLGASARQALHDTDYKLDLNIKLDFMTDRIPFSILTVGKTTYVNR